jgi:hypothetical protein
MNTRLLLSIALVAGFATAAHAQLFRMGATRNLSSVSNIVANGHLSLSGETNRLTVAGDALLLDGSAIGGDTIWNNTDGVIAPAIGQDTNVLRFTSGLPDNATNVAAIIDTEASWSSAGTRIFSVRNDGVEQFSVGRLGGVTVGPNTAEANNGLAEGTYTLLSIHDTSAGDANANSVIVMTDMDGQDTGNFGEFNLRTETNYVNLTLGVSREYSGSTYHNLSSDDATADGYYRVYINGNLRTGIHPSAADGSTAYSMGTSVSHTSGSLLDVSNNGTNKFSIAFGGATTIAQSLTEPAAPAAGYFTLFATNNAGKMVLKVKFPTGASQVIATEP